MYEKLLPLEEKMIEELSDAKPQKKQKPQQKAAPANPVKAKPSAPAKGKASHSTCGEGCEQMSLLEAMA